ncbi:MAG: energy transducer TonB [Gemmatimonadetes bacterium]|nr:energy transducer TonB [Gemmatimonadota bacterium]
MPASENRSSFESSSPSWWTIGAGSPTAGSSSSGFGPFDAAALETARTEWRFRPATDGREAVARWVRVPVRFHLRPSTGTGSGFPTSSRGLRSTEAPCGPRSAVLCSKSYRPGGR